MFYVYVIQHSIDKSFYIGFTENIERRLSEHNSNHNISTKRNDGKWILLYFEAYLGKADATIRESRLKKYTNSRKELMKRLSSSVLPEA